MPETPPIWKHRDTIWRISRLWLVVLALGMAVVGISFALIQARSFTGQIRQAAETQAAGIAQDARTRFDLQLSSLTRELADSVADRYPRPWMPPVALPPWVDGILLWNGTRVVVLTPPTETGKVLDDLRKQAASVLSSLPYDDPAFWKTPEPGIYHGNFEGKPLVLAYRPVVGTDLDKSAIAVRINVDALKSTVIEPLLPSNSALEVVPVDRHATGWTVPISGVLRHWAIKPTESFLSQQRSRVIRQTAFFLVLTILSLATLLIAMWFLVRVAKHEVALARLKANFVADVSHELKTPLALIRMFGETLQSGRVNSEEKRNEYYEIITREATRLTNLINNILDFARIEAGKKQYTLQPTDVAAVVRQTYHTYAPQLEHSGFEHHFSAEPDLPWVDADADAISQAVLNLVNNAQKYSDDDKYVAIDVTADTRRGKHGVLISVHDRGLGIRPEDRARLAEGFFRADDSRVRERAGTGLGLSLVRHIVQAHGGSLHVESRLVKGSTFRIFLPESTEVREEDGGAPAKRADERQRDRAPNGHAG